jgi:hypothetical protein
MVEFTFQRSVKRSVLVGFAMIPILLAQTRRLPRPGSPVEKLPEWRHVKQVDKQFVFFDSEKDEYVVEFPERLNYPDSNRMIVFRFKAEFIVEPSVSVTLSPVPDNEIDYDYTVSNASSAPGSIQRFSLVVPSDENEMRLFHTNWNVPRRLAAGMTVAPQAALFSGREMHNPLNMGRFATWLSSNSGQPIKPGGQLGGFRVRSDWLPGITTAYAATGMTLRTNVEIPTEVAEQLGPFFAPENCYRTIVTIGPKYARTSDNRSSILKSFLGDIERLIALGYLSKESAYVMNLVAYLRAQIEQPKPEVSLLVTEPQTPLEKEIAAATKISLRAR